MRSAQPIAFPDHEHITVRTPSMSLDSWGARTWRHSRLRQGFGPTGFLETVQLQIDGLVLRAHASRANLHRFGPATCLVQFTILAFESPQQTACGKTVVFPHRLFLKRLGR